MSRSTHQPTIAKVWGEHQFVTTCPTCGTLSVDVTKGLAADIALDHWRAHDPDAPPIEPPAPEHGKAPGTRLALGWRYKARCFCGLSWTGSDDAANAALSEHLDAVGHAPVVTAHASSEGVRRISGRNA